MTVEPRTYTPDQQARYDEKMAELAGLPLDRNALEQQVHWYAIESEPPEIRITEPAPSRVIEPRSPPLDYVFADGLDDHADEVDEIVEGILTRGGMCCLYGDSNSGKTFLAIDIACAIARGDPWMGRNVEPGLVVYLATESPASVRKRLRAYHRHHECRVPRFAIVASPIDLYDGDADTRRVVELVAQLERETEEKCIVVIGDTLSRLCAGANENSGEDMSIVVRHVDRIRNECGVHVLLIHHTGKDSAKGMRGWSGMRAATDTEIEITCDEATGARAAEITKQRDISGKGDRIGFRLDVVEMGVGKWGKPITSCVVAPSDAPPKASTAKRPSEIAGAIVELLTARKAGMRKGDIVDHFATRYTKGAVYREIKKMVEAHRLRDVLGIIGLVNE